MSSPKTLKETENRSDDQRVSHKRVSNKRFDPIGSPPCHVHRNGLPSRLYECEEFANSPLLPRFLRAREFPSRHRRDYERNARSRSTEFQPSFYFLQISSGSEGCEKEKEKEKERERERERERENNSVAGNTAGAWISHSHCARREIGVLVLKLTVKS